MILISFSCWKLGEKCWFAELGQCILQQDYTFMREEKLERYLEVEGIEPSATRQHKRIFKVGHQKPTICTSVVSCTRNLMHPKSVIVCCELSPLNFSGQRKICIMF